MRKWFKSDPRVAAAWAMAYKWCDNGPKRVQKRFNRGCSAGACPRLVQTWPKQVATLFQKRFKKRSKRGSRVLPAR
eukprot:7264691-Pyramimonas_sp.AAC.1